MKLKGLQAKGLLLLMLCFLLLIFPTIFAEECQGFTTRKSLAAADHDHDDHDDDHGMFRFYPKNHRFPSSSSSSPSSSSRRNSAHYFLGFFPKKQFPVPASSAPSRKHNDLGLQNWRSP